MSLLRLEGVRFTYRHQEFPALDGVDLEVAPGEWVGLLGAAGSGKSTLSLLPNGLIPAFVSGRLEGRIEVDGRDRKVLRVPETAGEVGLVMEDFDSQIFQGRVDLEVAFAPENLGLPRDEVGARIRQGLRTVGLEGLEDRDPQTLSGGQRQRLVLASVLAGGPKLLVLDEPWSDLDPAGRRELVTALRSTGCAVLVTGSALEDLQGVDRVVLLARGRVVADGPADRILREDVLLEQADLPLPPLADLFRRLGHPQRPLTVEEALEAWNAPLAPEAHGRLEAWPETGTEPGRGIFRPPEEQEVQFAGLQMTQLVSKRGRKRPVLGTGGFSAGPLEEIDRARRTGLGEPALQMEGVTFRYAGGAAALRDVSLEVRRGEMVALLGHNGSGKTTLARHFVGLLRPEAGSVRVEGRDVRDLPAHRLGGLVGYIFQNPDHQIFAEVVRDEVAFGPRNLGCGPEEVQARVAEALTTVGLEGQEEEDPFSMSRGDRQRLAVASALAARPGILLFDEPTTGQDPTRVAAMMGLVEGLAARGHAVVFITHSMEVAARYAHRIVLLEGGRVRADGPARTVLHDPEALRDAGLVAPPLVELAARLGVPACHSEELLACAT